MKQLFILLACTILCNAQQIRVICTAAITPNYAELRRSQYTETFTLLARYGYSNPYIVEALLKKGPCFLEDFSSHVFYATTNNPTYINNGINEAATLLEALYHFDFADEDMIIKFTGRHQLTSDYFLRLVEEHPEYDAFVKVNADGNVYTLGFAMRCKYIKEMYEQLPFEQLGKALRPIEYDVGDYIKAKVKQGNFKVYYVEKLHMKAHLKGSSTALQAPDVIKYY